MADMELQRQEYPALLTSLQPGQAVSVLADRVAYISKIDYDISEWLAERRRIEDVYAQSLRKLAARRIDGVKSLGVFAGPWQNVIASCEASADAHSNLSRRIGTDVEKPLQEYASKSREWNAVATVQGNLSALAKELDEAQRKADKLAGKKGGKSADAAKLDAALTEAERAGQQWQAQAPFVFEQLQALDEHRVRHLRDALTQLQTHEMDALERGRAAAEAVLNALLNVDPADEVSTFVAMTAAGVPSLAAAPPRRPSRPATSGGAGAGAPSFDSGSREQPPLPSASLDGAAGLAPPGASATDDRRSEVSAVSGSQRGAPPPPTPPAEKPKRGLGGGLKRLGTVMVRRNKDRESKGGAEGVASPEKKPRASRNPLRRGNSASRGEMQAIPSPNASMTELADTSARQGASAATAAGTTPRAARRLSEPPPPAAQNRSVQQTPERDDVPALPRLNAAALTNGTPQERGPSQELSAGSPAIPSEGARESSTSSPFASSVLDDITRAQQEAAAESEQQQFKLDIRKEPIKEEDSEAQKALSDVANTLRAQAQPPTRKLGTLRGRRDVRNTIFVPNPPTPDPPPATAAAFLPPPPSSSSAGPIAAATAATTPQSPEPASAAAGANADAQSVRSQHSMSSLGTTATAATASGAAGAVRHPELPGPGLRASLVETVSAWFEGGAVARAVVVGELALAHNADPADTAGGGSGSSAGSAARARVRLDNFPVLEKVAPNPAFVQPVADGAETAVAPGEYTVALAALAGPRPQVAFKYQVHLPPPAAGPPAAARHVPVLLQPSWKAEPRQISVMLHYAPNPAFAAADGPPSSSTVARTLQNVVVVISIAGARALSCQSKPVGTFAREKGLIYWRLGDVHLETLATGGGQQRLLARFATEEPARPGSVEVRWEMGGGEPVVAGAGADLGSGLGISVAEGDAERTSSPPPPQDPFTEDTGAGAAAAGVGGPGGGEDGASAAGYRAVPVVRRLVSGKYTAS